MAVAATTAGPGNATSNGSRSTAQRADLTADDVSAQLCQNGEDVAYYAIAHGLGSDLGAATKITFREPARTGPENITVGDGAWDTLYLGVTGPECGDIQHRGQVTVNYHYEDGIRTIVAQFNGKGELLRVNGVRVS